MHQRSTNPKVHVVAQDGEPGVSADHVIQYCERRIGACVVDHNDVVNKVWYSFNRVPDEQLFVVGRYDYGRSRVSIHGTNPLLVVSTTSSVRLLQHSRSTLCL